MKTSQWLKDVSFENGLNIQAMLETNTAKDIRIIMPKDEMMKEHKAPGAIVVQILQGKIWFEVDGQKHEFNSGDMLSLEALVPHSLGAYENSVIRLTLSKIDDVNRVLKVAKG